MNLQFYKWNNYYNRTYKPFSLTDASDALVGSILNVNGFNPNDGVDTEQMTGLNTFTEIPDYCVVVDGTEIISKWFVIECQRTRQGQYKLSLHRDLISDYYQEITEAPVFIEKGWLPYNSPLIFNREQMTCNKVKTKEILLNNDYDGAWIVAYYARNASEIKASYTLQDMPYDLEVPNEGLLTSWEYWKYCEGNSNRENLYNGDWNHLFKVYYINQNDKSTYVNSYDSVEALHERIFPIANQGTTCTGLSTYKLDTNYKIYKSVINNNVKGQIGAKGTPYLQNIYALDGKVLKTGSSSSPEYYRISVKSNTVTVSDYLSAGNLYNSMKAWVESAGGTNINNKTLWYSTDTTDYYISLEDVTSEYTASFTLPSDRRHLVDAPYDMLVCPYLDGVISDFTTTQISTISCSKQDAMDLMMSFATSAGSNLYDIQLLPYNPIVGLKGIRGQGFNISTGVKSIDKTYVKDADGNNRLVVFHAMYSKFSLKINITRNSDYSLISEIVQNSLERKVKHETELVRFCSPSGSNSWDFSPQMNDGFDYIQVDCTYKPYSPYIRVAPDFSGLYGDSFSDTRGLIVQGDFSLPVITDQWKEYEIQNKNYANVFDRETQSLELKEHYRRIQSGAGIVAGALGAAGTGTALGSAGGPIGMAVGAAVGAGASVAGGIADYTISKRLYEENMSYRQDMYSMNLENIQARPNGLAKTSAFTNNNKIYPFIEIYSATDTEKEALRSKILYNGMTVGVIGKITDYIGSKVGSESHHYVKGQLIQIDVSDDYHTCQAINNEINMGIRFPV